jgi:hypothetical protein
MFTVIHRSMLSRSRVHERTISFMFLGIIFRVILWISETTGRGVWFSIRFSSFLLYRNCKRLLEFEEVEISRQRCRGDCEQQGGYYSDFVWISSKNLASGC